MSGGRTSKSINATTKQEAKNYIGAIPMELGGDFWLRLVLHGLLVFNYSLELVMLVSFASGVASVVSGDVSVVSVMTSTGVSDSSLV